MATNDVCTKDIDSVESRGTIIPASFGCYFMPLVESYSGSVQVLSKKNVLAISKDALLGYQPLGDQVEKQTGINHGTKHNLITPGKDAHIVE